MPINVPNNNDLDELNDMVLQIKKDYDEKIEAVEYAIPGSFISQRVDRTEELKSSLLEFEQSPQSYS